MSSKEVQLFPISITITDRKDRRTKAGQLTIPAPLLSTIGRWNQPRQLPRGAIFIEYFRRSKLLVMRNPLSEEPVRTPDIRRLSTASPNTGKVNLPQDITNLFEVGSHKFSLVATTTMPERLFTFPMYALRRIAMNANSTELAIQRFDEMMNRPPSFWALRAAILAVGDAITPAVIAKVFAEGCPPPLPSD